MNQQKPINALILSLLFWLSSLALVYGGGIVTAMLPPAWSTFGLSLLAVLFPFLVTAVFLRYEGKSLKDVGLIWERATLVRFSKGLLAGSMVFTLIFLFLMCFSKLQFSMNSKSFTYSAIPAFLYIIPFAFMEEALFRSYTLLKLHNTVGLWTTQVITAIAFALYHIGPRYGLYAAFLGPGIWSFVFVAAAVWSRGIAVPTGIHVALNMLQMLAGMKGNGHSILVLSYKPGATARELQQTEQLGLVAQCAVLAGAVLFTAWMQRKRKRQPPKA